MRQTIMSAKEARDLAIQVRARNASQEYKVDLVIKEIYHKVMENANDGLMGFALYVNSTLAEPVQDILTAAGYKCHYSVENHSLTVYFG
jgi:hypothetical protein